MNVFEQHAPWLPNPLVFCRQMIVSLLSYLTMPLAKEKENAVQQFFKKNYRGRKDELIFDGATNGYFDKAINLISRSQRDIVLDLGCGDNGSFYWWLIKKNIHFGKYIGIDFSIEDKKISPKAFLYNNDLRTFSKYRHNNDTAMVVMSNSLCYLSDSVFLEVINRIREGDELLIFDPEPNLFWDAHFAGIMPIYRSHEDVINILESNGFNIASLSVDYLLEKRIKIAYALYGIKK